MMDVQTVAKDAAERVAKNAGIAPQLAFAPILWALQDAALSASPQAPGEAVAWRICGPRGGWMHTDKLPSSWRNAQPLYASPVPAGVTREALARVIHPQAFQPWEGYPIGQLEAYVSADRILALLAGKGEN